MACDNGQTNESKFEGTWVLRSKNGVSQVTGEEVKIDSLETMEIYKFSGSNFSYTCKDTSAVNDTVPTDNFSFSGTFTFTDTAITFITSVGNWTERCTLTSNELILGGGIFSKN